MIIFLIVVIVFGILYCVPKIFAEKEDADKGVPKSYIEANRDAAGLRRILFFAKKSIAKHIGTEYTPTEDWMSDKCAHTYKEYLEEFNILKRELQAFIDGGMSIKVGDLDVHKETYEEHQRRYGRGRSEHYVKEINMLNGVPVERELKVWTKAMPEDEYERQLEDIREWFKLILKNVDFQFKNPKGESNMVIVRRLKEEELAELQKVEQRSEQPEYDCSDDLPF